jgi:hypothetical protein
MARRVLRFHARPLIDALRRIYESGSKRPSFTVGDCRVSFDPLTGRLFAMYAGQRIGTVKTSGLFVPASNSFMKRYGTLVTKLLRGMVEHPVESALAGTLMGPEKSCCAVCRIPLNREDRKRGIGSSCWSKGGFEKITTVGDRVSRKLEPRRKSGVKHKQRRHENG